MKTFIQNHPVLSMVIWLSVSFYLFPSTMGFFLGIGLSFLLVAAVGGAIATIKNVIKS